MRIRPVHQRPLADPGRERVARETFPFQTMSAEEYTARYAHLWWCCSMPDYSYSEPELDRWIQRFLEIMSDRRQLDAYWRQYLMPQELSRLSESAEP